MEIAFGFVDRDAFCDIVIPVAVHVAVKRLTTFGAVLRCVWSLFAATKRYGPDF